jgi:NAD(P)-dependent dehydrogenase (short-subunit alcohol dehydrogenase family)
MMGLKMRASLRTVLVTGAAQRIGRAVALDLARHGWSVAVHYRSDEAAARELGDRIRELGVHVALLRADLGREDETSALVERAAAELGPLTCLVNNASAFEPDVAQAVTRVSWDLHLETNLRAPFVLIQHFARQLPSDANGSVINFIDQRVWNLTPFFTSYTVSKSGLWTLTRTLALALAPRIRVNAIGPGPALKSARQTQEDFERQCASTPLGRGTAPEEICDAVRFILGAPAMTGQMIALDGGQHLGWAHPQGSSVPRE